MTDLPLSPAPIEQAQDPAGPTKADPAHGTKARSCRGNLGAVTSVVGNEFAPEANVPQEVKGPHTISQAFERMNAPQMRRDARESLPFAAKLLIGAICGLLAVSAAHAHRTYALQMNWERIND